MKNYPLDIEVWHGDQVTIFTRGHYDLALFAGHAAPYISDYPTIEFVDPIHTWWRAIPDGDGGSFIQIAKPHSRGAWPVTTIEEKP